MFDSITLIGEGKVRVGKLQQINTRLLHMARACWSTIELVLVRCAGKHIDTRPSPLAKQVTRHCVELWHGHSR